MQVDVVLASFAVALPTVTALVGIMLSRNDYSKTDARLSALEGRLDGRMSSLENRFHSDMMQVIGKLTELEVRSARLEEKVNR